MPISPEQFAAIWSEFYWALLLGVASFGVKFLRDMSKSVGQLNHNIGIVILRVDTHQKILEDHEHRLRTFNY